MLFLGFVLIGLMIYFGIRGLTETSTEMGAVRAARLYRLSEASETLAEAVVSDAAVDPRAVNWAPGPARGPMRGVRATAHKGERVYEYRFDVDIETGAVHPSNPRSERVFDTLRAKTRDGESER
ncbi:MAG: hypothetical protein AAF658_14685, partial [Myxococcota bacterium]